MHRNKINWVNQIYLWPRYYQKLKTDIKRLLWGKYIKGFNWKIYFRYCTYVSVSQLQLFDLTFYFVTYVANAKDNSVQITPTKNQIESNSQEKGDFSKTFYYWGFFYSHLPKKNIVYLFSSKCLRSILKS